MHVLLCLCAVCINTQNVSKIALLLLLVAELAFIRAEFAASPSHSFHGGMDFAEVL